MQKSKRPHAAAQHIARRRRDARKEIAAISFCAACAAITVLVWAGILGNALASDFVF